MRRPRGNVAGKCLVAAVLLATPALMFSSPATALTISPGVCTDGDICIADGNLSGGSLTTSCRVYGWDLTSAESFVGPFSNYAYCDVARHRQGPNPHQGSGFLFFRGP